MTTKDTKSLNKNVNNILNGIVSYTIEVQRHDRAVLLEAAYEP